MSSILVIAKVLHAAPTVSSNCISGVSVAQTVAVLVAGAIVIRAGFAIVEAAELVAGKVLGAKVFPRTTCSTRSYAPARLQMLNLFRGLEVGILVVLSSV